MSKDRPSIVQAAEYVSRTGSDSRRRSSSSVLRDGNAGSHPRSVLVVSHHLDGFSSTTLRPYFRPLPILGFIAFRPVCERVPRDAPTALRSFPSADSCASRGDESPFLRGVASSARSGHLRVVHRSVHREPCPLVLLATSRPCSIVGSVARAAVASRSCPVLPWACPIRPVAVLFASSSPRAVKRRVAGHVLDYRRDVKDHSEKWLSVSTPGFRS